MWCTARAGFASLTRSLRTLSTDAAGALVYQDMRTTTSAAASIVIVLFQLAALSAQTYTPATLQLVVVDETDARLPHATVTIYTPDGHRGVRATADALGVIWVPDLAPGEARIVASAPGFAPALEQATLQRGYNAETMMLQLAPLTETVDVTVTPVAPVDGPDAERR